MKGCNQLGLISLVFALISCQKEEFIVIAEEEISDTKEVTLNSGFSTKSEVFDSKTVSTKKINIGKIWHSSVVHQGKMWTIEGIGNGQSNNIASSKDGISWETELVDQEFAPRWGHASVTFQNKIWVVGGSSFENEPLNDVWYSNKGTDWNLATSNADFEGMFFHTLTSFNEKIWVIGGQNFESGLGNNNIWSSGDGINWLLVTDDTPFGFRTDHVTVVFDNKLWVIGGFGPFSYPNNGASLKNDVWYSENGFDWNLATPNAEFIARRGHTVVSDGDYMWLIGGRGSESYYHLNDVWRSEDGVHWEKITVSEPPHKRFHHTSLFFDDKIWSINGRTFLHVQNNTVYTTGLSNIWYMEP